MDWSTINMKQLRRLREYPIPPTYFLQEDPGNGCVGDPPGFPTYFTRSIYTKYGNSPPCHLPQMVIRTQDFRCYVVDSGWKGHSSWDEKYGKFKKLMRRLWKPLPLDHPRTRGWIVGKYKHLNHCYNGYGDDTVFWPVPGWKLKHFHDDERFSDEWRTKAREVVSVANKEIVEEARRLATPENHSAVRSIRSFYPEYEPEINLIENPPKHHGGNWWETEAKCPSPEECNPRSMGPHPINGSWCQWCGWRKTK